MSKISHASGGRFWLGIILVALGVLFIADNFDILPYDIIDEIFRWQFILIIAGLVILFTSKDNFLGFILIGIGGLFLMREYFDYSISDLISDYWPVALIIMGLYILSKRGSHGKKDLHESGEEKTGINDDHIDIDAIDFFEIFSGGVRKIRSNNFRGGKITSIFAGPEVDFYDCKLADGTSILEVTAIFGGIELVIPNDWNVIINVTAIFGGIDDKRKYISKSDGSSKGTLIIKGLVLFGGGEIKN
jgi:predicted membrane protein